MPVYLQRVAWRMLAAIAHGRASLAVLAFALTLAVSAAAHDRPVVFSSPDLSGLIGRLFSQPCCHKSYQRVHAVNLASHQTVRALNGDSLLISALRQSS